MSETVDLGVRKSNYGHYYKINQIVNREADPTIAIFGSSVGEVGVDPRVIEKITGHTAYNYSIDGTRFLQYNGLVKVLNAHATSCKMVVFVETFFSLSKIDRLTEVDRYMAHIRNDDIYESLYDVQPELAWKLRHLPFYKFIAMKHSYYKASAAGLMGWVRHTETVDSLKGYTPKYKTWEQGLDSLNSHSEPVWIQLDSFALNKYRQTINEIRQKGRRVLIIIPPVQEDGLRLLPNLDVLRDALAAMQGEGVYFKDYSKNKLSSHKEYFYNNTHLNAEGADQFSRELSGDINSLLAQNR